MTAYRDSASVRKRDILPVFCCRINPSSYLLASVHRRVDLLASKDERVGAIVNDPLAVLNAGQMKSFFVLRRGRSGPRCMTTASVLAESWFPNPKKGAEVFAVGWR